MSSSKFLYIEEKKILVANILLRWNRMECQKNIGLNNVSICTILFAKTCLQHWVILQIVHILRENPWTLNYGLFYCFQFRCTVLNSNYSKVMKNFKRYFLPNNSPPACSMCSNYIQKTVEHFPCNLQRIFALLKTVQWTSMTFGQSINKFARV